MKLWIGQTISLFGDQFTALAVQLIGAFTLGASGAQMGLLVALQTAAFPIFGLIVGAWIDRHRPRRIMIFGDLGRGCLVAVIPIAAVIGFLNMNLLYAVAFLHGTFTVFFDLSYQAYIPALVKRSQIVDANSKMETSRSTAAIVGPSVAGAVIRLITAPFAVVFDSVSFFISATFLGRIRRAEIVAPRKTGSTLIGEAREGIAVVFQNRSLWSIAGCTGTLNFFANLSGALFVLFLKNNLAFSGDDAALLLGFLGSIGGIGALSGALTSGRFAGKFGVGRTIVLSALISGATGLAIPLASRNIAVPLLSVSFYVGALMGVIYNINQVSFRQAIVPLRLQGRMNATMRVLVWGTLPLGAIVGGVIGEIYGLYVGVLVGGLGQLLGFLWTLFSPVWKLKTIPDQVE